MIAPTLLIAFAIPFGQESSPVPQDAKGQSTLRPVDEGGAIGVGTPMTWRITLDDPELDGASISEPTFGVEWAVLDGPRDIVDGAVAQALRPDLVREWTLLPLTGGTLTTPAVTVTLDGMAAGIVPATSVEVLASLGETEEAPRPLLGFREAPDRRVGDPRTALLVLLGMLAAGLGLFFWRRSVNRRRAQGPAAPVEASPMEQLQGLDPNGNAPGPTMAALAPIFRRAFDQELPAPERARRSSLTDDAWGQEVEATSSSGVGVGPDAARLLRELSAYRYGGGEPTSFAVKDALKRATELAASAAAMASTSAVRVDEDAATAGVKEPVGSPAP